MVFVEGGDYRQLRRPGGDPAQFRSVVRPAQVPTAPDSVIHQYRGENFTTSTWTDSVGNADMSINGVSASTLNGARTASSDGVDDSGTASGPESLLSNSEFGISFVFNSSDVSRSALFGFFTSTDSRMICFDNDSSNSFGEIQLDIEDDNGGRILVETSSVFFDGDSHLVVFNKTSNANIDIYVDNMTQSGGVQTVVKENSGFDNTIATADIDMGFFGRNASNSFGFEKNVDMPFIEFNEQPYSQQDRLGLKQRAPGL
jgi:hypothetical protein